MWQLLGGAQMSNATTSIDDLSQNNFSIGRVLSQTFSVFFGRFLSFTAIGTAVYSPLFLFTFFIPATTPNGQMIQGLVTAFFYFFISPLATAIIVYAAFQHMRGGAFSLGASIARGVNRLLPLIGLSILWAFGVGLGFMLLVIPGVILFIMWYVIVPCCVVERAGPISSFGRSRELTRGVRWKLSGLLLVVFLILVIVSTASNALFGVYSHLGDLQQMQQHQQQLQASWLYITYSLVFAGIYLAFNSVLVVVTYYHLRQYKEGVDIEAIASVFD